MSEQKLTVGELVYKISGDMDNLKTELKKAETEINNLKAGMEKTSAATDNVSQKFNTAATAVKAFVAGFVVKQLLDFGRESVAMATEQLEQQTKLAQVLRVSRNATDEQIQSLLDQAAALEQVGVIGKDVTIAAQAQLATYDLSTDSIKTLTPALLNYVAAERGANATKDDAIGLTNGLAQAIQGNYGTLAKSGFILDDATKKLIEHGTETERVNAITEVLNSTYAGYNEALAGTFLGTQVRAQRVLDDFREDLGFALMPALQQVIGSFIDLNGNVESGIPRINKMGKAIYQGTNFIIALGKAAVLVTKTIFFFGATMVDAGKVVFTFAKDAVKNVTNVKDNFFSLGKAIMKLFKGDIDGALEEFKSRAVEQFSDTLSAFKDFGFYQKEYAKDLSDQFDSLGDTVLKAFDAVGFEPITAEALTAYDATRKVGEGLADMGDGASKEAEKAAKAIEDFQNKLVDLIEQSRKVSDQLNGELSESFKKFGDGIKESLDESNASLAKIVVTAEEKLKELNAEVAKEQAELTKNLAQEQENLADKIAENQKNLTDKLADEQYNLNKKIANASGKDAARRRQEAEDESRYRVSQAEEDARKRTETAQEESDKRIAQLKAESEARIAELQKQIDAENDILATREGFEQRQADKIAEIRAKLEDAGIDAAKAGLDDLLTVKSLQEQIDEERRRQGLNEFQLFEDDQNKKLDILVNNFIAEVKLIEEKIAKQKEYEAALTEYLVSEDSKRLESTDEWAKATIAKYGEVAKSLQALISLKSRLGDISGAATQPLSPGTPELVAPSATASQSIDNSRTINAPVTINAQGASSPVDYRTISREMGFEISRL